MSENWESKDSDTSRYLLIGRSQGNPEFYKKDQAGLYTQVFHRRNIVRILLDLLHIPRKKVIHPPKEES